MGKIQRSENKWVFPANSKQCDVSSVFELKDVIYWKCIRKISKGDIVYLYLTKPYQYIRYETKVTKLDIPFMDTSEDEPFWEKKCRNENRDLSFIELELKQQLYPYALSLEKIIKYDPAMPPQGPQHITKELEYYIDEVKSRYESLNLHGEMNNAKLYFNTQIEYSLIGGIEEDCWQGNALPKEFTSRNGKEKSTPKRDPARSANALRRACYLCEYEGSHKLFLRSNGKQNYTEPHHLIPMYKHKDFPHSLDVEENIVSLCSHCHNLLHYGRLEDKKPILKSLFDKRQEALKQVGLTITFSYLISYYV